MSDPKWNSQTKTGTDARVRGRFAGLAQARVENLPRTLASEGVDSLNLNTRESYEPALRTFFKNRARRMQQP